MAQKLFFPKEAEMIQELLTSRSAPSLSGEKAAWALGHSKSATKTPCMTTEILNHGD